MILFLRFMTNEVIAIREFKDYHNLYCIFNHEHFRCKRYFKNKEQSFEFEDLSKHLFDEYRDREYFERGRLMPVIALVLRDLVEIEFQISEFSPVHRRVNIFDFNNDMIHDYKLLTDVINEQFDNELQLMLFLQQVIDMYYRSESTNYRTDEYRNTGDPLMDDFRELIAKIIFDD